jgi:serine phosphatase RsbU (regulator of sigma subunit)
MERLLASFDEIFDLDFRVGGEPLRDLVRDMLRRIDDHPAPDWGTAGDQYELVHQSGPLVQFCYRPHLFPGMDETLRKAHQLQFHLLPRELPEDAPVSVAAVLESYCHLSGDLFGWEMLRDGCFLIWMLDVAGHGVRSGICSALVKILVDHARHRRDLVGLLTALNESMNACVRREHDNLFTTGFFCAMDPEGRAVYASGGHPPALVRRTGGGIEAVSTGGPPIGIMPGVQFTAEELPLASGDALLLYTDGVIESAGPDGEPLGITGVREVFSEPFGAPEEMTARIYRAVGKRQDLAQLDDDITFLVAALP